MKINVGEKWNIIYKNIFLFKAKGKVLKIKGKLLKQYLVEFENSTPSIKWIKKADFINKIEGD